MLQYRFKLITILAGLLFSLVSINTQAQPVGNYIIETPAPAAREVIVVPQGYSHCYMTKARWHNYEWIPSHQVCKYTNSPKHMHYQGAAWVNGHWVCIRHRQGMCSRWKWRREHWVKTWNGY